MAGARVGLPGAVLCYLKSTRSYRLPREELTRLQFRKLSRILAGASRYVPHYRTLFSSLGLGPEDVRTMDDLRRLPLLTKREVTSDPSKFRRKGARVGAGRRSTGTTGSSVVVDWSSEQLDVQNAMLVRRAAIAGFKPWNRLVTMWPPVAYWARSTKQGEEGLPTTLLFDFPFGPAVPRLRGPVRVLWAVPDDPLNEARALYRLSPDFLMGRPSFMRRVGIALRSAGLAVSPRALLVGGEVCSRTVMKELEELYASKALTFYGSSEFGALASGCSAHMGSHLFEDFAMFEVLKDGERVGPGEEGELVVTALHNEAMPLIRYRTGDLVRLSDPGTCGCGSGLTRVERFMGRAGDAFVSASGKRTPGLEVADRLDEALGLRDYQVVQLGLDRVELRLSPEQIADGALVGRVERFLEGLAGAQLQFTVKKRDEEEYWKKVRPVIGPPER